MTLQSDIFDRCTTGGHAGLSALIGTRCYPRIPEDFPTMPFLRWRQVSANNTYVRTRDGATDRAKYRVQFDCYAATQLAADALADQVVAAWDGYKGDGTGCTLGQSWMMNRSESYNVSLNKHRVIVDVQIERATDT